MTEKQETSLSPETTSIAEQDFKAFSKTLLRSVSKPEYLPYAHESLGNDLISENGHYRDISLQLLPNGIYWFNESSDRYAGNLGDPEDYVKIRNSYPETKEFISNTLSKGRIDTSTYGHGGEDRETNSSDYIQFMYSATSNEEFKQNVDKALIELTLEELSRNFQAYDYKEGRSQAEKSDKALNNNNADKRFSWVNRFGTEYAISSFGLKYPSTPEEMELSTRLTEELESTIRTITKEEYMSKYLGYTKEERQIYYGKALSSGKLESRIHFEEISPELKEMLRERAIDEEANKNTSEKFAPQFRKLIGLLELIGRNGSKSNELSKLYEPILDTIQSGIFTETRDLQMGISTINIENHMLMALAAIQPENDLRQFWLDRISNDQNKARSITAIEGLLASHKEKESKKLEIPGILAAVLKREGDLDIELPYPYGELNHTYNFQDKAIRKIMDATYEGWPHFRLDQEKGTLDVIKSWYQIPEYQIYETDRYTTDEQIEGGVSYNAEEGTFEATIDQDADVIMDFVEKAGFMIGENQPYGKTNYPTGLKLEALTGRLITSPQDSKIVNGLDNSASGIIEGVMMIDGTDLAYIFDPNTNKLLLSEDVSYPKIRNYTREETWQDRKRNLDEVARIPIERFFDLNQLGYNINEKSAKLEKRSREYKNSRLYGIISGKLEKFIVPLLKGRLVNNPVDLVS